MGIDETVVKNGCDGVRLGFLQWILFSEFTTIVYIIFIFFYTTTILDHVRRAFIRFIRILYE